MDNFKINIVNNNNKKVYTSFLITDENNHSQQITTDSQTGLKPPVLQAAQCECNPRESQSLICKETTQTIAIPVTRVGNGVVPSSIIYFSFSPGYAGGNDGAFDSIPVNYSFIVDNYKPPTYNLKNMNDKCKNIDENVLLAILLIIISLVLIIIGIIRHDKLWLLGVFFLILAFIVGYLSFRNKSN